MYTGITKGLFKVMHVDKKQDLIIYTVELNKELIKDLKVSDSVSIDGVCQTVVNINGYKVTFNAVAETLSKTTLGDLYIGKSVSVERSARYGDENGGHELAGHVFEMGEIVEKKVSDNNTKLVIKCSPKCIQYIFEKGFIGIDGSSLTIGNVNKDKCTFEIHLIPETLRLTNFGSKQLGDKVNIELDSKAKIIFEAVGKHLLQIQNRLNNIEKKLAALEN